MSHSRHVCTCGVVKKISHARCHWMHGIVLCACLHCVLLEHRLLFQRETQRDVVCMCAYTCVETEVVDVMTSHHTAHVHLLFRLLISSYANSDCCDISLPPRERSPMGYIHTGQVTHSKHTHTKHTHTQSTHTYTYTQRKAHTTHARKAHTSSTHVQLTYRQIRDIIQCRQL